MNIDQKFRISGPSAIRGRRIAAVLITASMIAGAAAPSGAQTVPVPKPAPKARDGVQLSASDAQKGPITTGAAPGAPPDPVIPDPHRNLPANIFATFDANQKAQAARVSSYLSSLQTLVGNFVQVGPDGSKTRGDFYIQKPGKVRFEYEAPSPVDIIADGSSLAVRDRKLATQDIYPLSQTPLRFLLSDRIDLLKDTNVVNVTADDVFVSVTIEEKQALIQSGFVEEDRSQHVQDRLHQLRDPAGLIFEVPERTPLCRSPCRIVLLGGPALISSRNFILVRLP